jgi:hypothetical protein
LDITISSDMKALELTVRLECGMRLETDGEALQAGQANPYPEYVSTSLIEAVPGDQLVTGRLIDLLRE